VCSLAAGNGPGMSFLFSFTSVPAFLFLPTLGFCALKVRGLGHPPPVLCASTLHCMSHTHHPAL
jgi:hypothetical protein